MFDKCSKNLLAYGLRVVRAVLADFRIGQQEVARGTLKS